MLSIKEKPWLLSLICTVFVVYPNAVWLYCELMLPFFHGPIHTTWFYIFLFVARFLFYWIFVWLLLSYNVKRLTTPKFSVRLLKTLLFTAVGFALYVVLSFLTKTIDMHMTLLVMQFASCGIICALIGYIFMLFDLQRKKEQEIEQLRVENLESRLNALTNQINPHFFFNSLNGISALIRKDDKDKALTFVNDLSDIFRYILQSEKKGLVSLHDELDFVDAFGHVMEVRYGDKLHFDIDVPADKQDLRLPVLSLLPLIENVVEHNVIDSEHPMRVKIGMSGAQELMVQNAIQHKLTPSRTNGTGLNNLQSRFQLLTGESINVDDDGTRFTVWLPLKNREV